MLAYKRSDWWWLMPVSKNWSVLNKIKSLVAVMSTRCIEYITYLQYIQLFTSWKKLTKFNFFFVQIKIYYDSPTKFEDVLQDIWLYKYYYTPWSHYLTCINRLCYKTNTLWFQFSEVHPPQTFNSIFLYTIANCKHQILCYISSTRLKFK